MADSDRDLQESPSGDDQGFLRRWSRRKAEAKREIEPEPPQPPQPPAETPAARREDTEPPVRVEDLPDIDTLDAGSDFKAFLRPGVPEHLRKLALRKMWRVDPLFSKLDGLVEYGEDYTFANRPGGVIRTAYQVGRGFVTKLDELAAVGKQAEGGAAGGVEPSAVAQERSETAMRAASDPPDASPEEDEPAEMAPAEAAPAAAEPAPPGRPRPLPRRG